MTRCRRHSVPRGRLLAATIVGLAACVGCAPGGTTAEDKHRLEQLNADPLFARVELDATLLGSSSVPGADDGPAGFQYPSWTERRYLLDGTDVHEAALTVAEAAEAVGWRGRLTCGTAASAMLLGNKPYDQWIAFLEVHVSPDGQGLRLTVHIETPHVSRPGVTTDTAPSTLKEMVIDDRCLSG